MRRQRYQQRQYGKCLAYQAARLMAESGIDDYAKAKRKLARRLGITDEAMLPRNEEIQAALREYQRLFRGHSQAQVLRHKREVAVQALAFFAAFLPRLTGSVLNGTADAHSPIVLHLHAEDADEVARFLLESDIPAGVHTANIRLDRQRSIKVPVWRFMAEGTAFELKVLPLTTLRQAPLSAFDDKPAPRATAAQVQMLLDEA